MDRRLLAHEGSEVAAWLRPRGRPLRKADVIEYLRNSSTISPQARQEALALVDRYRDKTKPEPYLQASWSVVRQPFFNRLQYRFALQQAETACRLAPEQGKYQTTLGVAQYRVGQCLPALATLTSSRDLNATTEGSHPADLGFLAMVQHQLSKKDEAKAALARLREVMKQPRWEKEAEAQGLLREAEETLKEKPANEND